LRTGCEIQWAEKGLRKEDFVQPWLRRMVKKGAYGVYFIQIAFARTEFRRAPRKPSNEPKCRAGTEAAVRVVLGPRRTPLGRLVPGTEGWICAYCLTRGKVTSLSRY
jgi:hypothetical protein